MESSCLTSPSPTPTVLPTSRGRREASVLETFVCEKKCESSLLSPKTRNPASLRSCWNPSARSARPLENFSSLCRMLIVPSTRTPGELPPSGVSALRPSRSVCSEAMPSSSTGLSAGQAALFPHSSASPGPPLPQQSPLTPSCHRVTTSSVCHRPPSSFPLPAHPPLPPPPHVPMTSHSHPPPLAPLFFLPPRLPLISHSRSPPPPHHHPSLPRLPPLPPSGVSPRACLCPSLSLLSLWNSRTLSNLRHPASLTRTQARRGA